MTLRLRLGRFLWKKTALSDMISMYADSVTNIKMLGYQGEHFLKEVDDYESLRRRH